MPSCALEAPRGLLFPVELRDNSEGIDSAILRAIVRKQAASKAKHDAMLKAQRRANERHVATQVMST